MDGEDDGFYARRGRVVSACCFRLLSLQLETQNEVDVLKPLLEELEVLRLSCALGALPHVNVNDFECELLEAKEFDADFARFLRSDVFGDNAEKKTAIPHVRVVGLFGKQAQLKAKLKALDAWDDGMAEKLQPQDLGLYAAVLPGVERAKDVPMLVVFAWLRDEYFHADRLRETPTYLLRLLTCLTNDVTCCLSGEDKQQFEAFFLQRDIGHGGDSDWDSYSAAFHVEPQQDTKDGVEITLTQVLSLPPTIVSAARVDMVKGSFPALMAVTPRSPTKRTKSSKKEFSTTAQLYDWLIAQANDFDLRVSGSSWKPEMVEELLRLSGRWPREELEAIGATFTQTAMCVEGQCRDEVLPAHDECRANLQVAGEAMFDVDVLLAGAIAEPVQQIKSLLADLGSDKSFVLLPDRIRTLKLPLRLPHLIKYCQILFQQDKQQELNETLEKAPTTKVKDMPGSPLRRTRGLIATMVSLLSWTFSEADHVAAATNGFRQRMRGPLETMQQIWWAEVAATMDEYASHTLKKPIEAKMKELRHTCAADCCLTVERAFTDMLRSWAHSESKDLRLDVSCHRWGASGIKCSVTEEVLVPAGDTLHVWSLKPPAFGAGQRQLETLGKVDLAKDEELLAVFTVKMRSVLVVSVTALATIVRKVVFDSAHYCPRPPSVTSVRTLPRVVKTCDYYSKERLFVLADAIGKVGVYRLSDTFSSMETVRTLDTALKTSLAMPLSSILLSDGVLFMTDCLGGMQSLNTRNQQVSRKKVFREQAEGGSMTTRLVRVLDGLIVGWMNCGDNADENGMKFVAAEDLRELPWSGDSSFVLPRTSYPAYQVCDDSLFLVDVGNGILHEAKLEASLKSESYRIRSIDGVLGDDATVEDAPGTESIESNLLSQHWLWTFYHLYEKFPVRGELFRVTTGRAHQSLTLSFACDTYRTSEGTVFDDGCQKLLRMIMEKLHYLNKPLYDLDLARGPLVIDSGQDLGVEAYKVVSPQPVATLLRELVTFVPMQICRAEYNTLTLMSDGQCTPPKDNADSEGEDGASNSLSSADIALQLRFGLLSPLLLSWRRQCIVVTSMGKQSTGKSYFLNHLTGSSFAISGARCTDGAWMSVRFLPSGVMLVVIDFEGLGSFERTEQEDVFLSVLNASVSMLTIFRMEMRLDKEIDELFSKFQKGSQLIKNDPQLFCGKLYMSVKDVNPNDQRGVVGEFVTKFQRLLEANKEQNFLTDMYAGKLDINCSPPLGTVGYYRSLSHAQRYIDRKLCGNPRAGFGSGKAFHDCVRLLLAKVSILDWTSLDESSTRMKMAQMTKKLPGVLRFGCLTEGVVEEVANLSRWIREPMVHPSTESAIVVSLDELYQTNSSLSQKWRLLAGSVALDEIDDEGIDLGPCVDLSATDKLRAASAAVGNLFTTYCASSGRTTRVQMVTKSLQHDFDAFLSFVVHRRCRRVQKWCRAVLGDHLPDEWNVTEQQVCPRPCVLDVEAPHSAHKCEVDRCLAQCFMDGCSRSCRSTDHFHGHTEAKIAFDVENPDLAAKSGGTFDASDGKPTIHMCDEAHACPHMCGERGICHIDVVLKQSSKTFVGARGSFQYTFQEMNGSRKKCAYKLQAGQMTHSGEHSCVVDGRAVKLEEEEETKSGETVGGGTTQVRHYCDVRCPCCSYYCQRDFGHGGAHGNMRNTMFFSEGTEIDLADRKYAAGERGTAEMCNLYCSKMGRGHVHFLDCERENRSKECVYKGNQEDQRRHCTRPLEPRPTHAQDEVLHGRFWETLGWDDPCSSVQEREEFGKCAYRCDAPDHEGKQVSHCVLPAWHPPATKPPGGFDGFSYVCDHKFECSHVAADSKMHHVFVLDASGSMTGEPWQRLNGAFREYVHNRIAGGASLDLVSVVTFDNKASIVWEGVNITMMTQAEAPFRGRGTSFGAGLRAANEVLSRVAFDTYKPVVVFFSDGQPTDGTEGEKLATHVRESYAKYGLEAFAVGFGCINLPVLQRVAEKLGGSYRHVLTGDELKATFQSISASLGTRAGLALTKPAHEMVCVICQKELASEPTTALSPCQHELHRRCLRRLVESAAAGGDPAVHCPTCRGVVVVA